MTINIENMTDKPMTEDEQQALLGLGIVQAVREQKPVAEAHLLQIGYDLPDYVLNFRIGLNRLAVVRVPELALTELSEEARMATVHQDIAELQGVVDDLREAVQGAIDALPTTPPKAIGGLVDYLFGEMRAMLDSYVENFDTEIESTKNELGVG